MFPYLGGGGEAIPLPSAARLQVIHNSADPAAAAVDVYVNDRLTFDDFAFRTATPFFTMPSGEAKVSIAPSTSTAVADAASNTTVTLAGKTSYVAVANGVITTTDFAANPDATSTALTVTLKTGAREKAADATKVEFMVVHGGTNAPTVDVRSAGSDVFTALSYGDISDYTAVAAGSMQLNVRPSGQDVTSYGQYTFDATAFTGRALTVVASGFLAPADNKNGTALGLVAYTAAGGAAMVLPVNN